MYVCIYNACLCVCVCFACMCACARIKKPEEGGRAGLGPTLYDKPLPREEEGLYSEGPGMS